MEKQREGQDGWSDVRWEKSDGRSWKALCSWIGVWTVSEGRLLSGSRYTVHMLQLNQGVPGKEPLEFQRYVFDLRQTSLIQWKIM